MTVNTPEQGTDDNMPHTIDGAADYLVGLLENSKATPSEPDSEEAEIEAQSDIEADADPEIVDDNDEDEAEYEAAEDDAGDEQEYADYVEIDGERITLDEIPKHVMRQADYTKKTQELAAQRKEYEAQREQEFAALNAEREHLKKVLETLGQQQDEEPIDWVDLAENDPLEYTRKRAIHDAKQAELAAVRAERERLAQIEAQQNKARMAEFVEQQKAAIIEAIPELASERSAEYRASILTYMQNAGYSKEELAGFYDARAVVMVDKARKYDELMSKGKQTAHKVKSKPKIVRPGVQTTSKAKATNAKALATKRARESGSIDDAVAALLS